MKHKIALLLTALFLVAGLSWALMPTGDGPTYYVSGSGSNSNEGLSASTALKTITYALEKAQTASGYVTINIAAGTYNEQINLNRGKVALVGSGASTIIGDLAEAGDLHTVLTISSRHISVSNLTVMGNKRAAGNTTGSRDAATILIDSRATEIDPIAIENVTVNVGGNTTGYGIYVGYNDRNATIRKVTVNGHERGIYVNATCSIDDVMLNGDASSEYGIYVNNGPVTLNKIVASGYSRAALMYNYENGSSTLTNSKLSNSGYGLRMREGGLKVSTTEIYGKGNDEPLYVEDQPTLVLGEGTKLYRSFDNTRDNNFIKYDNETRVITDNGAQFFYGTNYAKSRVIKVSDSNGLRNAYPVESINYVFGVNRDGDGNRNLRDGWTVALPAGDPITLSAPLNIFERITLEGNNVTLKGQTLVADNYGDTNGTATIQNLTVSDLDASLMAAEITAKRNLLLSNVTLTKGLSAIRIAEDKTVTATNLTTSGNTFAGVVLEENARLLIVSGDHISDLPAVASENNAYFSDDAVQTNGVSWKSIQNTASTGYHSAIDYFWVRKLNISDITTPSPSPITRGEQLWNAILTGGKAMYDGVEVSGTFQWRDPSERVFSSDEYAYSFIPDNQKKFAPLLVRWTLEIDPLVFYKVTTAVSNRGKVIIKNATPDNLYEEGQVLELEYLSYEGYKVSDMAPATFTVGRRDAEIGTGSFTEITNADKTQVSFDYNLNGSRVRVFNNGQQIFSGTYVERGSLLNVVVVPAAGQSLKAVTYQYGTPVLNGMITVGSEPIIIRVEMETKPSNTYVVQLRQSLFNDQSTTRGSVTFYDNAGNIYMPGMAIPNGTVLTPVVTPFSGFSLASLNVNKGGAYWETMNNAAKLTIDNNVEIEPVFLVINNDVTASMDNDAAGRVSFTAQGVTTATTAANGATVPAYIRINEGYKLIAVIANGKEVRMIDGWRNNDYVNVQVNGTTTIRVITRKLENIVFDNTQQVYTDYDGRVLRYPFVFKAVTAGLEKQERFTVRYREHSSIGSFSSEVPRSPGTYDVQITRDADDFYNELNVVVESGLKILDNYLPLRDMTRVKKDNPAKPSFGATATYDGSVFGNLATNPVTSNNWVVTYLLQNVPVQYPVNAGTYDIIGIRAADTLYTAQPPVKLGTFTINKAASNASVTYATDILQGQSLAASRLSGNANIDGTFSWASPETKMTTAGVITTNKAIFTPYSSNYTTDTNLATSLNVLAMAAGNLRTITVNVTNPEKGTYTLTREAIPVGAGTIITAGERIRVSFETTDPAYTAVLKINGVQYPNGTTYTIPATGDMVISLDFVKIGEAPVVIGVTGINLSSLERTVTAGDVFTLTPMITPANASDLRVFWASDNEFVASVDTDGKVTVHHTGMAVITATTADGAYSVSCVLNGHLTGNEDILTGVQVYTVDKQYICIEAGSPVKVVISDALGRIVYNASVNQRQLVNLPAGTYFVVVADQKTKATVKVML